MTEEKTISIIKRPKGRPKGTKLAPYKIKRVSPLEIEQMKNLYIAGKNESEIARQFGLKNPDSVKRRAIKEGWDKLRDEFVKRIADNILVRTAEQNIIQYNIIMGELEEIRKKAMTAISTDAVTPTKYIEATQAYIQALELEKKLRGEFLQVTFIQEVGRILQEEIQNLELLHRIGGKLRKLFKERE